MFETLLHRGAAAGRDIALTVNGRPYSHSVLVSAIERTAAWMRAKGIARQNIVVLHVSDAGLYWILFFALERIGAISLSVPPAATLTSDMVAELGGTWVLTEAGPAGSSDAGWVTLDDAALRAMSAAAPLAERVLPVGEDPICIVLSSGTTGQPKPVLLTREVIDLRVAHAIEAGFTVPRTRMACYMPFYSIGGLLAALQAWQAEGSIAFPSNEPPEQILGEGISDSIVVVPLHCRALVDRLPDDFRRTTPLTVFCGGAKLPAPLRHAVRARLNAEIIEGYGTTETGIVTRLDTQAAGENLESSGRVLPWFTVETVDESGRALAPGTMGIVRIRGEEVVSGYFVRGQAPEKSAEGGWYYPGDLGTLDTMGFLTIAGRVDDLMNLAGRKVLPQNVEALVRACPGVRDVCAFAASDNGFERLWLAVVADGEVDLGAIAEELAMFPSITVVSLPTLPRNAMGKVPRQELRARAVAGEFAGAEVRIDRGKPEASQALRPPSGPILQS
ncbi:class I adenylate-forming enzyme family protein [Tsuneonella sp. HG222]